MTEHNEPFQAQATRSFGDHIQGVWYTIDPADGQLMALLGAGYFSTEGNDNLVVQQHTYQAGEVVTAANQGIHGNMANQEHVNVEAGYQPANDVQVPEKMTGEQRATTADEIKNEAQTDGQVGAESDVDSGDRKSARTGARKSSGPRNN